MRWLRHVMLSVLAVIIILIAFATQYYYRVHNTFSTGKVKSINNFDETEVAKLNDKIIAFKKYSHRTNFSKEYIFLVDMSLPSGKNRFFVYDIPNDSIVKASLVAHGCGNRGFSFTPKFSNLKESGCTALGKYRVGKSYSGRFGLAYKLYGLDSTNSNAFSRYIVLHSYDCVPERETYPYPICNSRGCPMVAPAFLKQLQIIIDKSREPVLLWIFN